MPIHCALAMAPLPFQRVVAATHLILHCVLIPFATFPAGHPLPLHRPAKFCCLALLYPLNLLPLCLARRPLSHALLHFACPPRLLTRSLIIVSLCCKAPDDPLFVLYPDHSMPELFGSSPRQDSRMGTATRVLREYVASYARMETSSTLLEAPSAPDAILAATCLYVGSHRIFVPAICGRISRHETDKTKN
jgi:hypothetical protein